ncbi:hypothetical protein EPUS_02052 [Endocarpon pusillum Z07020]|uniref:C2H2-type domain-containing protein n=1 Tax=Endocarpon pusillum (strain Z07020 / HMAS-L-300199) TaxID=1263415 RepID=U1HUN6_ENDPU|nr:uncharacterized protein EPUS_02052 [Endocarpon pusillum Z07020]ERF74365.1 hypothetical protein EPUS_02052 [Endocarpon pusillum Z07020]
MSRNHPVPVRSNVHEDGQQKRTFTYRLGPSNSLLGSTRMIDYPTPPRTQSPATSISSSSAPTTPQGLGLLNCPFPNNGVESYSTASSFHPVNTTVDWSMPVSTCGNPYGEGPRLNLLPTSTHAMSSRSLNAIAFYTSPALSSCGSMPTPDADVGFSLGQDHNPVMLQSNFQEQGCPHVKQEDAESWFNEHVDMERPHSSMNLSSYGNMKSPNMRASHVTGSGLLSSPAANFGAMSPASCGQSRHFGASLTARSDSVESFTTLDRLPSSRNAVNSRRHSTSAEKRYVCSVCNRAFDKKYNLREHEKKHDPSRVSPHVCPEPGCGKRLGRRTDVNRHFQSVHEKAKRFVCTKCFKRFDRKDTLARHCDRDGACPYSKQYGEMQITERPRLAPSGSSLNHFTQDAQPSAFSAPPPANYLASSPAFPPY